MTTIQYLKFNKDVLKISAIEKRANLPRTMLAKWMKAGTINPKHEKKLVETLKQMSKELIFPAN